MEDFGGALSDALGDQLHDMSRNRPYDGQPWTDTGERGRTPVHSVTFRDLRDCFIRGACAAGGAGLVRDESEKGEKATLCTKDLYSLRDLDLMAVFQNMSCEVEKLMGIYPNSDPMTFDETMKHVPIIGGAEQAAGNIDT